MRITLDAETRRQAAASLQRYCDETLDTELGQLGANALLDYFLAEIAPAVYNQAVRDAQARLLVRVSELDSEVYAEPFTYWQTLRQRRKR